MPEKYAPKHRSAPPRRVRTGARNAVYYSGVAVVATGLSVTAGLSAKGGSGADGAAVKLAAGKGQISAADLAEREQSASRSSSDRRQQADSLKAAALSDSTGVAVTKSEDLTQADPKTLAKALMPLYGLSTAQFSCVDNIWEHESHWNVHADNPYSSAYGIPQALPGSKMSSAGPDWQNNAETQIRWGLNYIAQRYGSACSAWSFKQAHGWY
ncbi:lytic transglycosylase domain-containing protein [Nocardioides pocheonensis]|uniref:Lytic transglycosylase domain-containing protein n=1 Tax=Nocardioides pocheonensis TaxID=661485 RepID=A0A3N0GKM9_9ACTN|nr:lytic transglycosylase domain-containing protein [Nocardioides pocheonensis]RNM13025.1 lytic transglycosylase domain-containing protein [Nocardioides pocheonensis]